MLRQYEKTNEKLRYINQQEKDKAISKANKLTTIIQ